MPCQAGAGAGRRDARDGMPASGGDHTLLATTQHGFLRRRASHVWPARAPAHRPRLVQRMPAPALPMWGSL